MTIALRGALFASLLVVAIVAGEFLIYQPLVVPRLITWREIPWHWWLAILGPALAGCAIVAMLVRRIGELLSFALIGALLVECLMWLAHRFKLRGHLDPIEGGPVIMLLAHYLVLAAGLLGVVGAFYLLRLGLRRVGAS